MNEVVTATALKARVPLRYRAAAQVVLGGLTQWRGGALTMRLPDGSVRELGDRSAAPAVTVTVKDWTFFWRALTAGDIGVGESYMAGEWECSDLVEVCRCFLRDQSLLDYRSAWTLPARLWHAWLRLRHANTLRGSRRNIEYHYDLSNDLYRLFLDESMMYSCAVFEREHMTLAEAQRHKID